MIHLIFFGSDAVAVPALRALATQTWCKINLVVTQPAKPVGRKQALQPTQVFSLAEELGLPVQTNHDNLAQADVAVVVDYGRILPAEIQQLFTWGIVNIHPSLLPRWRGPSPIQTALLAGDQTTGVTLMKIDDGIDTGPILAQESLPIELTDTAVGLEQRLSELGASLLVRTLPGYCEGKVHPTPQPSTGVTHSTLLKRVDGEISVGITPVELWNRYRGLQPWPGVYCFVNGKRLKLIEAHWQNGSVVVDRVQLEGKPPVTVDEFNRGYPNAVLPF